MSAPQPPKTDSADSLFWKVYGQAILTAVGNFKVNDTTSFYLSTNGQRGPPGGDGIGDAFTNEGLYNIGNNLLPPDQLFYSPSTMNSYIRQLQTYLSWVDCGGTPDSAHIQQITNTQQDMDAAGNYRDTQFTKALALYNQQADAKMVGSLSFAQWYQTNAQGYVQALRDYNSKAQKYQQAVSNAYGPLASQKLADEGALNTAMSTVTQTDGFNMPCSTGSPPSAREIQNATNNGTPLQTPNTVLRPTYVSQGYVGSIKNAQMMVGTQHDPKNSIVLNLQQASNVEESKFNSSATSGGVSFSYWPWISFSASGGTSSSSQSLSTANFAQDIKVTLQYDSIGMVPIGPSGSWDLGNVRVKYPKLLAGHPKSIETLVKPTAMVLATRLGYIIQVSNSARAAFDSMSKQATSGGGSVNIFGIPCSFGGGHSSTSEQTTHNASWNSNTGVFTVSPTDNCGFASIVGMIGEKMKTF